jgi:integrase
MPKYSQSDIEHIVSQEEFNALYRHARSLQERAWLLILWFTGARPAELLVLVKRDIVIEPDKISFKLHTAKLGKTTEFIARQRNLVLQISSDNRLVHDLQTYLSKLKGDDSRLFTWNVKTGYNVVVYAARKALGKDLCPYNFRHSRMTLLAEAGASEEQLKRFKGSFTTASVRKYLHVRKVEYTVEV